MIKICVIALVGLPASGKTTFCEAIVKSSIEFNCIHVCYDQLFTFMPHKNSLTFKDERKNVLQKVEQIVNDIRCSAEDTTYSKQTTSNVFIIFCDDNNYYSGMRYEVYKLCRAYQLSFGQIYFPLNLDIALARNTTRTTGVLPYSVIEQMNERLDVPSPKNQWEKNTFTVQGTCDVHEVQSFLEECIANPLEFTRQVKGLGTKIEPNSVHEIDILLRKRIKELLQNGGSDRSERAKVLNNRRKCILREAKTSEFSLTADYFVERLLSDEK